MTENRRSVCGVCAYASEFRTSRCRVLPSGHSQKRRGRPTSRPTHTSEVAQRMIYTFISQIYVLPVSLISGRVYPADAPWSCGPLDSRGGRQRGLLGLPCSQRRPPLARFATNVPPD